MTIPSDAQTRRTVLAGGTALLAAGCADGDAPTPDVTAVEPDTPEVAHGTWRRVADLPYAAQEIYPTALRGHAHLAGGFIAVGGSISGPTDHHIAYDPANDTWTPRARLPAARHHPNLVAHDGQLYAIGGFLAASAQAVWVMQRTVWIYDPTIDAWSNGPQTPMPTGECVTASLATGVHLVGGRRPLGEANASWRDHSDTTAHLRLDRTSGAWETAAPALSARNSAAGAVIDGRWHVVGGRTVTSGNVAHHEVYDPVEDRCRTAAPMPQAQGGLAAAAVGGKLYAFGGEYFGAAGGSGGGVYPQAWRYDPEHDEWAAITPMPTPRHGLGAVAISPDVFVLGGATGASGSGTSSIVEAYRPG